jgi:transposase
MKKTFELPIEILNIPDIEIIETTFNSKKELIITVESTKKGTLCHQCGKNITKICGHGHWVLLRHTSVFGLKTYIRIRAVRYQCDDCNGIKNRPVTTSQKLDWYQQKSQQTKDYERYILLSLINGTIEDVCIMNDIGYKAVESVVDRHIDTKPNWKEINHLGIIGIDEISLKKGHKDFVTIITANANGKIIILAVLKDRLKLTVKSFLQTIPKRLRRTVKTVCSDMYDGFINAAKEVFGKKVIVVDRFHVAKTYRKGMERLRIKELKRLKKILSTEEYQQLKNVMWILRKQKSKLIPEEIKVLNLLFIHSPELKQAYDFCNELTQIFDEDMIKSKAKRKMNHWIKKVNKSGIKCFDDFLSTLRNRMDEITNYFKNRRTSGFVEGFNNKIKVIKRRCYGILNIEHLFQRIVLDLDGYKLFL